MIDLSYMKSGVCRSKRKKRLAGLIARAAETASRRVSLMARKDEDFAPVTGGVLLAEEFVRNDPEVLQNLTVESELDLHIVRLLRLHPNLKMGFRDHDLTRLSDHTKQALLQDMNDVLGIKPLRSRRK